MAKRHEWTLEIDLSEIGTDTSGNYGHGGVKGQLGGSAPGGGHGALGVAKGASKEEKGKAVGAHREEVTNAKASAEDLSSPDGPMPTETVAGAKVPKELIGQKGFFGLGDKEKIAKQLEPCTPRERKDWGERTQDYARALRAESVATRADIAARREMDRIKDEQNDRRDWNYKDAELQGHRAAASKAEEDRRKAVGKREEALDAMARITVGGLIRARG